jgi:hypothetical protein
MKNLQVGFSPPPRPGSMLIDKKYGSKSKPKNSPRR